jgi:hypothetical protein
MQLVLVDLVAGQARTTTPSSTIAQNVAVVAAKPKTIGSSTAARPATTSTQSSHSLPSLTTAL